VRREFKDRLFEQFARVGKALASPKRLEIVDLLAQGERTVEEIARQTTMSVASASQHLTKSLSAVRPVWAPRQDHLAVVLHGHVRAEVVDTGGEIGGFSAAGAEEAVQIPWRRASQGGMPEHHKPHRQAP
jgi:DNA-binding transcriptional ArsR family regulator